MFPIHRKASRKGEIISNQGIFEEFLLGHKVKQWLEGQADDRDIGPVLMFGEDDHWPLIRKRCLCFYLDPIKKGIQTAAANTIFIAMDLNNPPVSPAVIGDVANEYIEYSYNGADTITRNVSCGGDQVILGGTGSATMVRNAATTPVTPLFQYFDSSNNNITTTVVNNNSSTINGVPAIRRIRITIVADTESKDSLTTSNPRRMTYTTDVLVKNHAFNN